MSITLDINASKEGSSSQASHVAANGQMDLPSGLSRTIKPLTPIEPKRTARAITVPQSTSDRPRKWAHLLGGKRNAEMDASSSIKNEETEVASSVKNNEGSSVFASRAKKILAYFLLSVILLTALTILLITLI